MVSGEYVFYTMDMLPESDIISKDDVWYSSDDEVNNGAARTAFEAVFHVSVRHTCN